MGTGGLGDLGTWGLGDWETWGLGDLGTGRLGDLGALPTRLAINYQLSTINYQLLTNSLVHPLPSPLVMLPHLP